MKFGKAFHPALHASTNILESKLTNRVTESSDCIDHKSMILETLKPQEYKTQVFSHAILGEFDEAGDLFVWAFEDIPKDL